MIEERLKQREAELAEREIDLLQRELNVMILQQQGGVPTPKKRKGNFKKSRLKLLKNKDVNQSTSSMISAPLGKHFALWNQSFVCFFAYAGFCIRLCRF